jgi:hypothetical protein
VVGLDVKIGLYLIILISLKITALLKFVFGTFVRHADDAHHVADHMERCRGQFS